MRSTKWLPLLAVAGLAWAGCDEQPISPESDSVQAPGTPSFAFGIGDDTAGEPVRGAVYTSTENREIVNANQYDTKPEVYFNGGPSDPDHPKDAALLEPPEPYGGETWFWVYQVTNPSGSDLLSEDPWYCRVVAVRNGRFYRVPSTSEVAAYFGLAAGTWGKFTYTNKWAFTAGADCSHDYGGPFNAGSPEENVSVQLYPYSDTPNNGGVYKAWATPGVDFQCKASVPDPATYVNKTIGNAGYPNGEGCATNHGFVHSQSKTDNYKVKEDVQKIPAEITVQKFHDANFNGTKDAGEAFVEGWQVDVTDPFGSLSTEFTTFTYVAGVAGLYTFVEETPAGTLQTVAYLDGVQQSLIPSASPTVQVTVQDPKPVGQTPETHLIVYGNVGLGSLTACKIYDADADGQTDVGEPGIPGWKFELSGTLANGNPYATNSKFTGSNGCVTWDGLFPGDYTVTEVLPAAPPQYYATGGVVSQNVTIASTLDGSTIAGSTVTKTFFNYCTGTADFGTKGFWHNKNGLDLITGDMIAYVNGLDPYDNPTPYFTSGDEPFDGYFSGGACVAAAFNNDNLSDGVAAGACTPRAEISHFLTESVGDGGQCEQLAQQLLAFIFNVEAYTGGGAIETSPGVFTPTADIIAAAIAVWQSGDAGACSTKQGYLAGFNESDAIRYVAGNICTFTTPY
jgi:hypothetical protein